MKNNFFRVLLLGLILSCTCSFRAFAIWHSIPSNRVYIVNSGNKEITFQIRPTGGDWSGDNTLGSGDGTEFSCVNCTSFEVQIPTNDQKTTRTLNVQRRYLIFWSASEKLWDIKEAVK